MTPVQNALKNALKSDPNRMVIGIPNGIPDIPDDKQTFSCAENVQESLFHHGYCWKCKQATKKFRRAMKLLEETENQKAISCEIRGKDAEIAIEAMKQAPAGFSLSFGMGRGTWLMIDPKQEYVRMSDTNRSATIAIDRMRHLFRSITYSNGIKKEHTHD